LDVKFEPVGLAPGKQVQRRGDDQFVAREILGWPGEIHQNVAIVKRIIEKLDVFAQAEEFIGLQRLLQGPIIVMTVKDAGFGLDVGSFDGR